MYYYYNQQDSNECFIFLMDIFETESKKLKADPNHPFLGYFVYKTKCLKCNKSEFFFEKNQMVLLDLEKEESLHKVKDVLRKQYQDLIKQ